MTEEMPKWEIETLEEAEFVINVLHRRSIRDLGYTISLADRIRFLELPWHKRAWKKMWKRLSRG